MRIDASRAGGSTVLRLDGRLDREWAEHLSTTLEDLLRDGVRSVVLDFSAVTYVSSAASAVISRRQQELAALRGEIRLTSIAPAVREMFAVSGWDPDADAPATAAQSASDLRQSSWHMPALAVRGAEFQTSTAVPDGRLTCRICGRAGVGDRVIGAADCEVVGLASDAFGLGLGAIGGSFDECRERVGELVAAAGCVAHFPGDGTRLPDYLVAEGPAAPRALLASGLLCRGAFSKLLRFSGRTESEPVTLSELAGLCLEASGGRVAGLVVAGETAGLVGARLRRSPAAEDAPPMRFEVPAIRDWLSFAPERTHASSTALITGIVARAPDGPLAEHLRPLSQVGRLFGHFHAAVFSYGPLPQRTVDLGTLLRGLFRNHQLRDVLHLVWDDRGEGGAGESALFRGVGWVGPVTQVS